MPLGSIRGWLDRQPRAHWRATGRQAQPHRLARLQFIGREPGCVRAVRQGTRLGRRQDFQARIPGGQRPGGAVGRCRGRVGAPARRRDRRSRFGRSRRRAQGHEHDAAGDGRHRRSCRVGPDRDPGPAGRQRHRAGHRARRTQRQAAVAASRAVPACHDRSGVVGFDRPRPSLYRRPPAVGRASAEPGAEPFSSQAPQRSRTGVRRDQEAGQPVAGDSAECPPTPTKAG
jgi:hypothetical protein